MLCGMVLQLLPFVIRGSRSQADRLATAIAGEHAGAAQREQALIIAESELTCCRADQHIRTDATRDRRRNGWGRSDETGTWSCALA